jgi:hypothetical protein
MKNRGFLIAELHRRRPGDHAKPGKSRESIRAIVMRRRRASNPGAAGRRPVIAELLRPLAWLGVVAMTVQRDRKTR